MLTVPILAIVGDTEEEQAAMAKLVRAQIGFYGATPAYAFQFDRLGLDGLGGQLERLLKQGDVEGQARLLTDEVLAQLRRDGDMGRPARCSAARYAGGRADRLVAYLAQPMWQRDPATLERRGDVAARLRP